MKVKAKEIITGGWQRFDISDKTVVHMIEPSFELFLLLDPRACFQKYFDSPIKSSTFPYLGARRSLHFDE